MPLEGRPPTGAVADSVPSADVAPRWAFAPDSEIEVDGVCGADAETSGDVPPGTTVSVPGAATVAPGIGATAQPVAGAADDAVTCGSGRAAGAACAAGAPPWGGPCGAGPDPP